MTKEEILSEIASLPPEARREIENYIEGLRKRYTNSLRTESTPVLRRKNGRSSVRSSEFFGLWKNRKDIKDGLSYVRKLRNESRY